MKEIPAALINSLKDVEGFNEESFLQVHSSGEQVTSIRINPFKESAIGNKQIATGNNPDISKPATNKQQTATNVPLTTNDQLSTKPIPWCATGKYLSKRPSFTLDPLFHAGAYYVQEASSMFIDHVLKQLFSEHTPGRVLDLCAAPGGKSTLLASALPTSFIVSNEVIKSRVTILAENISKWGSSNVVVTHNDPRHFQKFSGYFDLLVVDAPCSGSGLFRKDINAVNEWSEENVDICSMRQQRILADAIPAIKNNGYLIYSTCSYSKKEDEDICDWIVDNMGLEPVSIAIDPSWGIIATLSGKHNAPGYRFYPDKLAGEGFFIACFKQVNDVEEMDIPSGELQAISKAEKDLLRPWLKNIEQLEFFKQKETIIAFPREFKDDVSIAQAQLNVRKSGVAVGSIKGKDFIPHHELALSQIVNDDLPYLAVDYDNAIQYLKRKDLVADLPPKGWMLMKHEGLNLGWIKVLPNRINNYYPTEWRILKD